MTDVLCADWLGMCEGTGFWPGFAGWDFLAFLLVILAIIAIGVLLVRYRRFRREMDE